MGQEDEMMMRKGPWTEHEDARLVSYVNMFGDRRWDFIAKVSGLKRSGKSCRLRWVNYLHPGLRRGKMTPHEEHKILELHSKWGNRWSRIARKLPGRTDNEIKNYWRTYMRKKAQEMKGTISPSSSLSESSSSSSICTRNPTNHTMPMVKTKEARFYDTEGKEMVVKNNNNVMKSTATSVTDIGEGQEGYYSMDEIWKDIDLLEDDGIRNFFYPYGEMTSSSAWDYSLNMTWNIYGQEDIGTNMFFPTTSEQLSARLTN